MYSLRLLAVMIVVMSGIVISGHAAFIPNQNSFKLRNADFKAIVPTSPGSPPMQRLKASPAMVGDGSKTPNTKRTLFCVFDQVGDSAKKIGTAAEDAAVDFRRSSRQISKSLGKIGNTFCPEIRKDSH